MSRPVIYRTLPAGWVLLMQAELNVRLEANAMWSVEMGADRARALALLEGCADKLHALWQPHEKELAGADLLFAEMQAAIMFGEASLDYVLPEAGIWACSPGGALYMRFADSISTEEPELVLLEELLAH